jgi:carbamoyltransferase
LVYDRFDEYKVMGLAPYGNPTTYAWLFDSCCRLLPEGNYELDDRRTWFARLDDAGLLKGSRRRGKAFESMHIDFAAALQATLEKIVLHVIQYFQTYTGCRVLCMAGGVAHNCTLNGKILASGIFDQVFVQPAAHDAGSALGAAMAASLPCNDGFRDKSMTHVYFGTDVGLERSVSSTLRRWKNFLDYDHVKDVAATSASLLAEGAVVGWVQGRAEFGPRALGNRSILADPRPASNKDRINQMVKKREAFRPFAPSVLEEQVGTFFVVTGSEARFPFMLFALQVQPEMRSILGAVTHVDGTARIQTVSRQSNPLYWRLLREFELRTGIPILLNTSFNNNAEPIVNSVDDAIACFLTTGLDYLIVGDFIVRKSSPAEVLAACGSLVAELPLTRKLIKRMKHRPGSRLQNVYELESTKSDFFGRTAVAISPDMYNILLLADEHLSLHNLIDKSHTSNDKVITEAFQLWTSRLIKLSPATDSVGRSQVSAVNASYYGTSPI